MSKVIRTLFLITILSGIALSSSVVSADDDSVVDEINVTVPVSCTLFGTGMNTHNATINNGQYNSAIGETTMKAFCNDSEGFAIYVIGYTDNTDGKNVLTNSELGSTYDIATGTQTTGSSSGWAMKLSTITSPEPTYPITIQNNFASFQEVPDDYTLVAKRTANTDLGTSAEGSTLKSTYQSYISPTQPAGTYTGQVKYVMVHPHNAPEPVNSNQIGVIYNGNGLTFANNSTTNRVVYSATSIPMYISANPEVVSTSNISSNGTKNTAYSDGEYVMQNYSFDDAAKVKVVIEYGLTGGTACVMAIDEYWDGDFNDYNDDWEENTIYSEENISGTRTFLFEGNTVTVFGETWGTPESGYDYGFYAKVFPIYTSQQADTEATDPELTINPIPDVGTYTETTTWKGYWYTVVNGKTITFASENEIIDYLNANIASLVGTTITINAGNPTTFDMVYADNNKVKINNHYTIQDLDSTMCDDVTVGQTATVIDIRDSNTYMIGKLEDNRCWLLDNLALDLTNQTVQGNLTSQTTNASDTALSYLKGINSRDSNNDPNGNYATSGVSEVWASNNNTSYNYTNPRIYATQKNEVNYSDPLIEQSSTWKYGIFYNYCAASAGTYCYDKDKDIASLTPTTDISEDICPAGWRIPTGSDTGEYQTLGNTITETNSQDIKNESFERYRSILHLPLSGYADYGTIHAQLSIPPNTGFFWSSTFRSEYCGLDCTISNLKITISETYPGPGPGAYPSGSNGRYEGESVRCILKQP